MLTVSEWVESLGRRGYEEQVSYQTPDASRTLHVGDRIRKTGQNFGYEKGTGTIEKIFWNRNSRWSQIYHADDVELVVKNDDGTYSFVAQYHVIKVGQ